ncbi:MAG TPA: glycerol-3-phosphate 1-O-acyltransferase PlsY [Rectinemataceae bacterium]|nr:glycerol-3-phosphate 1-O-acyltransferase PlsY [Rectinemataceae bacterium]
MGAIPLILGLLAAYLLGSIPTGLIVGKLFFHKDPRDGGSGATGATNIFRQFGAAAGLAVTAVDISKGVLAVMVCSALGPTGARGAAAALPAIVVKIAGALLAVLGHVYPVFAGFRGGKGVATGAGALLAIAPGAALFSAIGFVLALGATGIVSASSIAAALILPVAVALGAAGSPPSPWLLGFSAVLAAFVVFTHRANIGRICGGREKSFDKLRFLRRRR